MKPGTPMDPVLDRSLLLTVNRSAACLIITLVSIFGVTAAWSQNKMRCMLCTERSLTQNRVVREGGDGPESMREAGGCGRFVVNVLLLGIGRVILNWEVQVIDILSVWSCYN